MGYTHYWYRPRIVPKSKFLAIVWDFRKLLPAFEEAGLRLANWDGGGEPEITDQAVNFNGSCHCGHPKDASIIIPWPEKGAGGVGTAVESKAGTWFAGVTLQSRTCDGDCSYESFNFPRVIKPRDWEEPKDGKWFVFCKTGFRPYDIAVTAFLVIAKHHLGKTIIVRSDGEGEHWFDGKMLCAMELGYGLEFKLDEGD